MYYGYPFRFYFDPTYFLLIIGMIFSLAASAKMKSTFAKYRRVRSDSGLTGAQTAQRILHAVGIYDVEIIPISGSLTDHYDPRTKRLALSQDVYGQTSVASVCVAAHECGHAIQHATHYAPLSIRGALVPVANFGSSISWPLIIVGLFMRGDMAAFLINIGILLFSAAVLFQIVTLPVEINASRRAMNILEGTGMLYPDEAGKARSVLRAAALTYVASAASAILQLLRLLILTRGRRNDD